MPKSKTPPVEWKKSTYTALRWMAVACLFAGACVAFYAYHWSPEVLTHDRHDIYLGVEQVQRLMKGGGGPNNPTGLNFADSIEHKIGSYHQFLREVNASVISMATLCIMTIVVGVKRAKTIKIPWVDLEVPVMVFLGVVPLVAIFSWASFGYTLNTCLDARLNAVVLIRAQAEAIVLSNGTSSESSSVSQNADSSAPEMSDARSRVEANRIHYTITRASELEDRGLLDGWFWAFYNKDFLISTMNATGFTVPLAIMVCYSVLLGCSHALVIACLLFAHFHTRSWFVWVLSGLCILFALAVLLMSNYAFYVVGRHPNWLQYLILFFAAIALCGATTRSVRVRFEVPNDAAT